MKTSSTLLGEIQNRYGEKLDYTLHLPTEHTPQGRLVILGHGVTANKDRQWAISLAEALAAAGFFAIRISFSGNGASEGAFEDSTVTKEVKDLTSLLDIVSSRTFTVPNQQEQIRFSDITYIGHSMGGAVGVITAAQDPRIHHLVSLAGMVSLAEFATRKFGNDTPGESHMWGKEECPLSQTYMDDMKNRDSVLPLAPKITIPWLLLHGTEDTVVPLQDSLKIIENTSTPTLIQVPGADHLFSSFEEQICSHTLDFLQSPHF